MDIPEAIQVITREVDTHRMPHQTRYREALQLAILCMKAHHQKPTHAVICEDPELAKAIAQDVNILSQLAFASNLTLNDDLKNASKHGASALEALRILAVNHTYQVRLDALYD